MSPIKPFSAINEVAEINEQIKAVQASLNGILQGDGCPHRHGMSEGPDRCDANEMRVCVYETGNTCELFQEVLEEWRIQYSILSGVWRDTSR